MREPGPVAGSGRLTPTTQSSSERPFTPVAESTTGGLSSTRSALADIVTLKRCTNSARIGPRPISHHARLFPVITRAISNKPKMIDTATSGHWKRREKMMKSSP